jgi:hypothetical protein
LLVNDSGKTPNLLLDNPILHQQLYRRRGRAADSVFDGRDLNLDNQDDMDRSELANLDFFLWRASCA